MNALISGTGSKLKFIFVLNSPFIEEAYKAMLHHVNGFNVQYLFEFDHGGEAAGKRLQTIKEIKTIKKAASR